MLESVVRAFSWINPLLGQMAPSPCRAHKPQSVCHPYCNCVCTFLCVCAHACAQVYHPKNGRKKKRKEEKAVAAKQWQRWWMALFWFWNMTGVRSPSPSGCLCVCVCARAYSRLFLEQHPWRHASISSWKIWSGWLAWHESMFIVEN